MPLNHLNAKNWNKKGLMTKFYCRTVCLLQLLTAAIQVEKNGQEKAKYIFFP